MLQGLLVAILVQSLLLAALCFTVRRGDVANRWLGIYFLTIAFQRIFHIVLRYSDWLHRHPEWVFVYEVLMTLGLWSLHCFVLHLLNQSKRRASQIFVALTGLFVAVFFVGFYTGHWADTEVYYHHPVFTIAGLA
ncbi:MAG: hypothetical protein OHK0019_29930 [Saprospiraceae bacterium]